MKKLIVSISFVLITIIGWSQSGTVNRMYELPEQSKSSSGNSPVIELTPLFGYQLNGRIDAYRGRLKMNNAENYGIALSVGVKPRMMGEFSYSFSPTDAVWSSFDGIRESYDMTIHYFQVGGIYEVMDGPVKPFGLISLGVTWFDVESGVDDHVSFSGAIGAGLKFYLSDRIGIRLQGRFLMPMYFEGGGLFLGIGTGGPSTGVGISTGILTTQGDFSGGLIFRF